VICKAASHLSPPQRKKRLKSLSTVLFSSATSCLEHWLPATPGAVAVQLHEDEQ
jgi:hypothetical protein